MVTVHIWHPSTTSHGMGHAAIEVRDEYLSIGSMDPREPTFPWIPYTADKLFSGPMFVNSTWNPDWPSTYQVHIEGLDEVAIVNWIRDFKGREHIYRTLTVNCSWITYRALQAGSKNVMEPDETSVWHDYYPSVVTPMEIFNYARDLQSRI